MIEVMAVLKCIKVGLSARKESMGLYTITIQDQMIKKYSKVFPIQISVTTTDTQIRLKADIRNRYQNLLQWALL